MEARKYEIISSVNQDISRVSVENEWDILVNTRNEFHISKHPCLFCLLCKILPYIPCKNSVKPQCLVNDNRHM